MSPARIECWSFGLRASDPWKAPELLAHEHGLGLHGKVFGHPIKPDGKEVTTSRLIGRRGSVFLTKSGNEYILGEVDPAYEKEYPDALNRMMSAIKDVSANHSDNDEDGVTRG